MKEIRFPAGFSMEQLRREHPRAKFSSGVKEVDHWLATQSLRDCHQAGKTFAFVAVIIDCLSAKAKEFYQKWDFTELPGHPFRLFLSSQMLDAMMLEGDS